MYVCMYISVLMFIKDLNCMYVCKKVSMHVYVCVMYSSRSNLEYLQMICMYVCLPSV